MSEFKKPIVSWFVPRVTPYGGAPEEIKRGWVDVPLPLRYDRPAESNDPTIGRDVGDTTRLTVLEDHASVSAADAVKALRIFERHDAADWWENYFGGAPHELAFAVEEEDHIFPADFMKRILPGIETFDEVEI